MDRSVLFSFFGSAAFHAALFVAYIQLVVLAPAKRLTVINDVDLLMPERVQTAAVKASPPSAWNFLKLAIPEAAPSRIMDRPLEVKAREIAKSVKLPERLVERSGRAMNHNMIKMDAGHIKETIGLEDISSNVTNRSQRAGVALAPRIALEEVGAKRAPSIPSGIRFDEKAPPMRPQSIGEVSSAISAAKRASSMLPAGLLPEEPARRRTNIVERIGGVLPPAMPGMTGAGAEPRVQGYTGDERELLAALDDSSAVLKRSLLEEDTDEKRGIEIEGPLAGRKVVKTCIPEFPAWARERGILDASVYIRFYVDPSGKVMDLLRIERTSGYGALDRLALEALKKWVFAPLAGSQQKQWGIITFRFIME